MRRCDRGRGFERALSALPVAGLSKFAWEGKHLFIKQGVKGHGITRKIGRSWADFTCQGVQLRSQASNQTYTQKRNESIFGSLGLFPTNLPHPR
jgi:hypothetical protein